MTSCSDFFLGDCQAGQGGPCMQTRMETTCLRGKGVLHCGKGGAVSNCFVCPSAILGVDK